jgi:monoterpene epsilon-lactone hydrolase
VLRARDEGLPAPAAAVLLSLELDLTEPGDTFFTNAGIDGMGSHMQANLLYAAGRNLTDPYLSPLFGDVSAGFPPTLLTAGTRDMFLSNGAHAPQATRRRRAG